MLKVFVTEKSSVFSVFSHFLCGFDPHAFSEEGNKKVWPNSQVPRLVQATGHGRLRGHYWDAVVKRDIATFDCDREKWQSTSCAEEPGPEQLESQAQFCSSLKAAEKLDEIQKRTIKLGQRLEMILHKERELVLLQLLRREA